MSKHRPIIGITQPEAKRTNLQFLVLWLSLWLAGGKARVIRPGEPLEQLKLEGLLLGGGTDVFPGLYFKKPKANYPYDRERDNLEIRLLRKAQREQLPVFAICRGAQLMNIVNGGSLHLDIRKAYAAAHYPENIWGYLFFRKKIHIRSGTLLHRIVRKEQLDVNSIHRQSIQQLGEGLQISSREPNGIIQSIEKPEHPFYLGLQFHPERLFYRRVFRRIFLFFIRAARRSKQPFAGGG